MQEGEGAFGAEGGDVAVEKYENKWDGTFSHFHKTAYVCRGKRDIMQE
jgi:hypothetical protein